ncbi:MAG: hypothetical protein IPI41_08125 [Flavobacteriales bacterium]|nr:hypothetical protein [Flavobacteriales bacterium]
MIGASSIAQTPTWSEDVACIVYSHCAPCHREGGAGHFSLTSFTDAYTYRNDMRDATQLRLMPPWPPDQDYRTLAHERVLSQDEIDIIAAWANGGGPEGDPGLAPPPPTFSGNWVIAQPDITARMEEYVVPPSTNDNYRAFVLPINNPVNSHITGFEVVPGNTEIVHHVLVFADATGQAQALDDADPAPGYASFGGIGVSGAKLVGLWVPGADPVFTPASMGIPLEAGADLVMQVHYPAGSNALVDSTRINLQLSPGGFIRDMAIDAILEHFLTLTDGPLVIPANTVKTFHNQYTTAFPATITAIGPHAHLICTSMKAFAVAPGNDTIPLIDIPAWDFRWQGLYQFRKPIYLPANTVLYGEATYDNTANNESNPNDPPEQVTLGEATTDEMMLFYFGWTYGFPIDTTIVVDIDPHPAHHLDCETSFPIGIQDVVLKDDARYWPIPSDDVLYFEWKKGPAEFVLRDATGRSVCALRVTDGVNEVDLSAVRAGLYLAEVRDREGRLRSRTKVLRQ